jgi:hypothetical protein
MRTSNDYSALTRLATATCIQEPSKGSSFTSFIALSHVFVTSPNDGLSKEVVPCEYVSARATTCPIFQCFVCLCENFLCQITSQSCISSIHTCIIMHFICSYIQESCYTIHTCCIFNSQSSNSSPNSNCQTVKFNSISIVKFDAISTFQFQFQSCQSSNSKQSQFQFQFNVNSKQFPISISISTVKFEAISNLQFQFQFQ